MLALRRTVSLASIYCSSGSYPIALTQTIPSASLKHAHVVRRIVVADYSESDRGDGIYRLSDVDLEVQAYELHEALTSSESEGYVMAENEEVVDEPPGIRTTNLPHQSLQETWNS